MYNAEGRFLAMVNLSACRAARQTAKPQAAAAGMILLLGSFAFADNPPIVGRPEDFSGMVGAYKIAIEAQPTVLHVEEPITLIVTITGTGPDEHQPERAALRLFPDSMKDDFYIEPLPEKDRRLDKENAWEFAYRLKPRRESVSAIPALKLVYYHPGRGKFLTTYAGRVELKVMPRPQAVPPEAVIDAVTAPPSFFQLAPVEAPQRWRLDQPVILAVLLLTPPLLAIAWRLWTRGNGVRVEQQRRSQAARHALHALANTCDAARASSIVNDYLRQRLDVPMAEPAPNEVERILSRAGVSKPLRRRVVEFSQACAALRFSGSTTAIHEGPDLSREARQLIQALEAESCLR
jgi:hypothetical protein